DIYVMDPRNPASNRMVAQVQGGGWNVADFSFDGRSALVINYISVTKSNPYLLDIASGLLTPIGDHSRDISYGGAEYAPDGTLWVTSDENSDFQRLGRLDPATGRFTPVVTNINWDVARFYVSDDSSTLAIAPN